MATAKGTVYNSVWMKADVDMKSSQIALELNRYMYIRFNKTRYNETQYYIQQLQLERQNADRTRWGTPQTRASHEAPFMSTLRKTCQQDMENYL